MATVNKITLRLKRSIIGTTPNQMKNLTGLGLTKRGKIVVLDDTGSTRGMILKVIHLVEIQKGDKKIAKTKVKKQFEVIAGEAPVKKEKAAKKETAATATKKTVKKTAKK